MADPKYEKLEKELFDELYGINQLDASLGQYVQNNTKLQKYNDIDTPPIDTFDTDAQASLRLLSSLGFDELGQSGFEDVMSAWNTYYKSDTSYQIDLDRSPMIDGTKEKKLRAFAENFDKKSGTVTIGNSCPITDGGSALLFVSEEAVKKYNLKKIGTKKQVIIVSTVFSFRFNLRLGKYIYVINLTLV